MLPFAQRFEMGPWFEVGQKLDGAAAHTCLSAESAEHGRPARPYCIYVHVPFCPARCTYCALYTREVTHDQDRVFDEYLDTVREAIAAHPCAHRRQPPTTVHFGGGTPLSIGSKRFAELTSAIRDAFGDSNACEWAVETTTSSIAPDTIAALKELGFQRLHLGIQTLNDEIRRYIGRRESGGRAIERIQLLHASGFLLSIDLIIGFEQSTEAILLDDLNRLYNAGIRMFSICELRNLSRTGTDDRQRRDEISRNYNFWQYLWQFMEEHQLIPIHLGQFARSYQDNLYYTHPARGEDCIALGPYAHGSAGRLYYANKLLPHYYDALREKSSAIEFGVLYSHEIQKLRNLESQLLAHRILTRTVEEVKAIHNYSFNHLWDFWSEHALVVEGKDGESFGLSQEGSWFVGNLIAQVRQLAQSNAPTVLWKRRESNGCGAFILAALRC